MLQKANLSPECLAELRADRNAMSNPLLKPERRHCGFKRGDDALIKRADGTYNEGEVLKQTYYECYHCGGAWRDTKATRKQLDESSYYVASNPNRKTLRSSLWRLEGQSWRVLFHQRTIVLPG